MVIANELSDIFRGIECLAEYPLRGLQMTEIEGYSDSLLRVNEIFRRSL